MPDPFQRPNPIQRPNSPQQPNQSTNPPQRRVISTGGNSGGNRGSGGNNHNQGGNNHNPPLPSPWLDPNHPPSPDPTASFVEYLRWMRSPDHDYKDATKIQILQLATDKANYNQRLQEMNRRLTLMAGKDHTFQVKSSWRIRVGGHRGAENILLPAFDNLGIPFIPSASLKGVARNQAIRELMIKENLDYQTAEKHPQITKHFGNLEGENSTNNAGQVIFFDAYPLPSQHGLTMDMANNIWNWEGNNPNYSPNPNVFLSLEQPTFLIGLKLASNQSNLKLLEQVKQWLIKGLESGIGSQINTGYGQLITAGKQTQTSEFLRVDFTLEGQLIHGYQSFTQWSWNDRRNEYQMRGKAQAEVRPIAFKSMLRYWFRVFALGVLNPDDVKTWEATLFGGINPQRNGYFKVNILDGKVTQTEPRPNHQGKNDPVGEQQGTLILSLASTTPKNQEESVKKLARILTWFMFNLGGIGQGARRPCYSRQNRERAPWFRGSTFYVETEEPFWDLPDSINEFKQLFQQKLKQFYQLLNEITQIPFDYRNLRNAGNVRQDNWYEVADLNCRIIICKGQNNNNKIYALSVLHSPDLKITNRMGQKDYDGNLCGQVTRNVKPSPVWIADLGDYQIVTVFGATENPRRSYLEKLNNPIQIFPLT